MNHCSTVPFGDVTFRISLFMSRSVSQLLMSAIGTMRPDSSCATRERVGVERPAAGFGDGRIATPEAGRREVTVGLHGGG